MHSAFASGVIILLPEPPMNPTPAPIADRSIQLREQHIQAAVTGHGAVTTAAQTFYNPNTRQVEGEFLYPLPTQAAVDAFSFWMNGKEVKGELLDAPQARKIYEDIVRRTKDPALLEYAGQRLLRCRIFPIPAQDTVKVRVQYTTAVLPESGMYEYCYALRRPGQVGSPAPVKTTLDVTVNTPRTLGHLYSPTHKIDARLGDDGQSARVSLEGSRLHGADFRLFWTLQGDAPGVSCVSHRLPGEDGWFLTMITPPVLQNTAQAYAKDITFVIDRSGSMGENGKMEQARRALRYCLNNLGAQDRFNIVPFSTAAETFRDTLVPASSANVTAALTYANQRLEASGGTAIHSALQTALTMNPGNSRPYLVVFLTDGLPTIGETNPDRIRKDLLPLAAKNVRLFVWGVGYDVNTDLLELVAGDHHGAATFVTPGENLEIKLSSFYQRIAKPALTDVTVAFNGAETYAFAPRRIGDIFHGQPVTVLGRYKSGGAVTITLNATLAGAPQSWTFETTLASDPKDAHAYVPRLWALRRVGTLLDQIRLHGENEEIKTEIVKLAKRYGILTPYTSWLVVEDERQQTEPAPDTVRQSNAPGLWSQLTDTAGAQNEAPPARAPSDGGSAKDKIAAKKEAQRLREAGAADFAYTESEDPMVETTDVEIAESDEADDAGRAQLIQVAGRTFARHGNAWIDTAPPAETVVRVIYGSDAYWQLLDENPALGPYLALGNHVTITWAGITYEIIPEDEKEE